MEYFKECSYLVQDVIKTWEFLFLSESIYLFFTIQIVPFKIVPNNYSTIMPAFFPVDKAFVEHSFWYSLQLI